MTQPPGDTGSGVTHRPSLLPIASVLRSFAASGTVLGCNPWVRGKLGVPTQTQTRTQSLVWGMCLKISMQMKLVNQRADTARQWHQEEKGM